MMKTFVILGLLMSTSAFAGKTVKVELNATFFKSFRSMPNDNFLEMAHNKISIKQTSKQGKNEIVNTVSEEIEKQGEFIVHGDLDRLRKGVKVTLTEVDKFGNSFRYDGELDENLQFKFKSQTVTKEIAQGYVDKTKSKLESTAGIQSVSQKKLKLKDSVCSIEYTELIKMALVRCHSGFIANLKVKTY